ncbi:ABC transporter ATP-binding protein [Rubrimonas sp.]|uniref:ABC transporter ATP-binding protein n=1 Tax=Rubrimonas sp. TaxID=2036015 RepID=UPI002FDDD9B7
MTSPLLEVEGLSVTLDHRVVVDNAALVVRPGEVVGLIGPNGAGKSSLLRAALGLVPASGARRLAGRDAERLTPAARARVAAFMPQGREIGWPLSVRALAGLGRPGDGPDDRAAVAETLARLGLQAMADRPATRLSGGEQARALMARALAQDAPLIVADEPCAGLDPAQALALVAVLRGEAARGRGVLLTLHDLGLAANGCDRLAVMQGGCIVADAPPAEALTAPLLAAVYGVSVHLDRAGSALIVQPLALAEGEPP